jgi:hypothetical protein
MPNTLRHLSCMKIFMLLILMLPAVAFSHGDHAIDEEKLLELYSKILSSMKEATIEPASAFNSEDFLKTIELKNKQGEHIGYIHEGPLKQMIRYHNQIVLEEMLAHCHLPKCEPKKVRSYYYEISDSALEHQWRQVALRIGDGVDTAVHEVKNIWHHLVHSLTDAGWAFYRMSTKGKYMAAVFIAAWEVLEHVTPLGKFFNKFPICKPMNTGLIALSNPVQLGWSVLKKKVPLQGNIVQRMSHRIKTTFNLMYFKTRMFQHDINLFKAYRAHVPNAPPFRMQWSQKFFSFIPGGDLGFYGFTTMIRELEIFFQSFNFDKQNYKNNYLHTPTAINEAEVERLTLSHAIDFIFQEKDPYRRFLMLEKHFSGLYFMIDILETYLEQLREDHEISKLMYMKYIGKTSELYKDINRYRNAITLLGLHPQNDSQVHQLKQDLAKIVKGFERLERRLDEPKLLAEKANPVKHNFWRTCNLIFKRKLKMLSIK